MIAKLIVGYRTRAVEPELLKTLMPPDFKPKRNLKDQAKIEADVEARKEAFAEAAKWQPYTGTFDSVVIADPANDHIGEWNYEGRQPGGPKTPICLAVAAYLMKAYPDAWTPGAANQRTLQAIFIGFNPRLFLKMLGEECSLPEHNQGQNRALPLGLWYSNSDHRDIMEAVVPTGFPSLTFDVALKRRRPIRVDDAARWDRLVEGWQGPHHDPKADTLLIAELASQLGFFRD